MIRPTGTASAQALEEMIRRTAHDFRAPVRQISAFAEFLREDLGSAITAESERNIDFIQEGAKRLSGLIDGYNALALASSKEIELGPIPVTTGLSRDRPGVEVLIPEPAPQVLGDPGLMRMMWRELSDSAVCFSRKTRSVQVSAEWMEESVMAIDLRIRDPGLEACEVARACLPIPNLMGNAHDPGMSMAVSCSAVERMGGVLLVSNSPDGDLILRVEIPGSRSVPGSSSAASTAVFQ